MVLWRCHTEEGQIVESACHRALQQTMRAMPGVELDAEESQKHFIVKHDITVSQSAGLSLRNRAYHGAVSGIRCI